MKKIFSFAMAAALAFGLASCSKDAEMNGGAAGDGNAAFQFSLKTAKGGYVTYADIATTPEWAVDDVSMYIFNAVSGDADEGKLIGTNDDFDETTNPADHGAAVLTAKDTWLADHKGKDVNVYFVGNKGANSGGASHTSLTGVGSTTMEEDFVELLTNTQANDGTKATKLGTPLLFSASATTTVPSMGKVVVPVQLKRREARFDIVNTKVGTFNIDKVVIKNAAIEGYIFSENTAVSTASLTKMNIEEITTIPTADADGLSTSVFYLYPTQLGVGQNTEISIVATVDGKQSAYPVNSSAKIEANKRYKLVLKETPYGLVFDVVVADYDEGEVLDVVPMNSFTITNASAGASTGTLVGGGYIVKNDDTESTITFDLHASTNAGVDISPVTVMNGTAPTITATSVTDANITYSNIGYKTTVTVKIGKYSGTDNFDAKFTISDKQFPEVKTDFTIIYVNYESNDDAVNLYYPGTVLKAVKVGNVYWAPVNVGASTTDATILGVASAGLLYQEGRSNIGWDFYSVINGKATPVETVVGPVSIESATTGENSNKFIGNAVSPWLWGGTWSIRETWDDLKNDNTQGPCPDGWRVPSLTEYQSIIDLFTLASKENNRIAIANGQGETLYFPKTGQIGGGIGNYLEEEKGTYWSTTPESVERPEKVWRFAFRFDTDVVSDACYVWPMIRTGGAAVRCVKNVE